MKIVVCIKQVPAVSELDWNAKTGSLKRGAAGGMINPACRRALEAALRLKETEGGHLTVLSMGPASAEEAVREALALGADAGAVLSDPALAGSDTLATSYALAGAIKTVRPDFDLVLCGLSSADSETGQVGPQLAEELDLPGAIGVEALELRGWTLRLTRVADGFLETLEMDLPGLAAVSLAGFPPRHVPLTGLEPAFGPAEFKFLTAADCGLDPARLGHRGSPSRLVSVQPAVADKQGRVYSGSPKRVVEQLLDEYGDRLGGAAGRDFTPEN